MNENEFDVLTEYKTLDPNRNLNISGLQITLCNEMIQKINDQLVVTFTTTATLDEIIEAFKKNEVIQYDDQRYEGYQMVMGLSCKVDNMGTMIHQITLEVAPNNEAELLMGELTDDQKFAISYAAKKMSDTEATKRKSLFLNYEDIKEGEEIKKGLRLNYKDCLWKCNETHPKNAELDFPGSESGWFTKLDK